MMRRMSAFLFADLIVLPILAIYRKYYGTAFTVRITALIGRDDDRGGPDHRRRLRPAGPHSDRPAADPADIFGAVHVDYKLALNVLGTIIFAALFWLTVRRGEADPVCGMKVDRAKAIPPGGRRSDGVPLLRPLRGRIRPREPRGRPGAPPSGRAVSTLRLRR
jgi:hypothetical protein